MNRINEKLIKSIFYKETDSFNLYNMPQEECDYIKRLMLKLAKKKDEEFLENLNVFKVYINSLDFTVDTEKEREFLRTQISNAIYKIILKGMVK